MPDLSTALRRVPWAAPQGTSSSSSSSPSPGSGRLSWRPTWSEAAAMRAIRAVVVIPSLFAICYEGFGNLQLALFAAFGGFASLIMASFGGSARDKMIAHLGLTVTGSIALIIGTAVSGTAWLAALVTIPVAFGIFFAGVAGPNAASGVTAALLAYVLPVASPGSVSMIPDRLAGWWLASVVSTAAVLLFSPPSPGDRLRAAAAGSARTLSVQLATSVLGRATAADLAACQAAKHELLSAFATTPYRPTGLATADQGLASVVQLLEWCTALIADAVQGHPNLDQAAQCDRDLLGLAAGVLREAGDILADGGPGTLADAAALDRQRAACTAEHRTSERDGDYDSVEAVARHAFHAQVISVAAEAILADALIATRAGRPGDRRRAPPRLVRRPARGDDGRAAGGRAARRDRRHGQARELPLRLVPEQPAGVARAGRGGARRLDEALRGFLAEQGAKKVSKEELWMLVMATTRLRLTAYSLAGMQAPEAAGHHAHRGTAYARTVLTQAAADLAAFYERVAVLVGRPAPHQVLLPVSVPAFTGLNGSGPAASAGGPDGGGPDADDLVRVITAPHHPHLLWVHEHLQHLSSHAGTITEPASHVAEQRRVPWWR